MRDLFLLPPRPRKRDWLAAGLSAGVTLGWVELLVAIPGGQSPPPELALLLLTAVALCVAALGVALGVGLELAGVRLTHSGMLGAMLGPILGAGVPGALWLEVGTGVAPTLGVSGIAAVALFAAAAGLVAERICDALENGGIPVSAPLIWVAAALSMTCGARILADDPSGTELALLVAGPVLALTTVVVAHERARRRGANLIVHPTRMLGWASALALVTAVAPWIRPWVFYDEAMGDLAGSPASVLVVAVDESSGGASALDWIASNAVSYADFVDRAAGLEGLLRTANGTALGGDLRRSGYATHATAIRASTDFGIPTDASPGPRRRLERDLHWMSGASLLLGPGSGWLEWARLDRELRSAAEVVASANRWLVSWRSTRAPTPFFLVVDLRSGGDHRAEPELSPLLERLEMIGVADRTGMLVVFESAENHGLRVALQLPPRFQSELRGVHIRRAIEGHELADALIRLTQADPAAREFRSLPGVEVGARASVRMPVQPLLGISRIRLSDLTPGMPKRKVERAPAGRPG